MSIDCIIIKREVRAIGNRGIVPVLGGYVKEEMDRQGVTQAELERRTEIPDSTLSRILNNEVEEAKPSQIARIAAALGLKFWELMQRAGYTTGIPDDPDEEVHRLADVLRARPVLQEIVRSAEHLTPEEQQATLVYMAMVRQQRPVRRPIRRQKKPRSVPKER